MGEQQISQLLGQLPVVILILQIHLHVGCQCYWSPNPKSALQFRNRCTIGIAQ